MYNYETNKSNLPTGITFSSYCDNLTPAQDHLYLTFDPIANGWSDGEYTITITATDIDGNDYDTLHILQRLFLSLSSNLSKPC